MKRFAGMLLLLLALILCGAAAAEVEINEASFPDGNFRGYILENVDADADGTLSAEELKNTTTMNCYSLSIASLKGIEYFEELETLICGDNQLEELDVSRNRKLIRLYCSKNRLTRLNVRNNPKLQLLDCAFNQLTGLDLSQNRRMVHLDCYSNRLTVLKVSSAKLNRLWVYDNALKKLDISRCGKILKAVKQNPPTDYGTYWGYVPERTCNPVFAFDKTVKVLLDEGTLKPVFPKPETGDFFTAGGLRYQVTAEGKAAFTGLERPGSASEVSVPASVKYNGYRFSVTEIAEKALDRETKVVRLTIGRNVKKIGKHAFRNCTALKTVVIRTSGLTAGAVGANAFKGIHTKASIQVPAEKLKEYREWLVKKGLPKTVKIKSTLPWRRAPAPKEIR